MPAQPASAAPRRYYITTAIPYANAQPHLGHVFELLGADVVARAKRQLGYEVCFQTGTDEHGQKMLESAQKHGKPPKGYADEIAPTFQQLWADLDISIDRFIRSTDADHQAGVIAFWQAVQAAGDITLGSYEGWYSVGEETFYLPAQAKPGPEPGTYLSPETGEPLVWKSEENYTFRWSRYQEKIERFLAENPHFIAPKFRENEMVGTFLKPGLQDLSISRSSIDWGIPVPGDERHVVYVWFDALINYITGIGYGTDREKFEKWWPADLHVVGKDILKFHTLLWPAMLMAAGLEPPRRVFGHGFVMPRTLGADGQPVKMSKSKGNVVNPRDLLALFGGNPDPIRYFLLREIDFGQDGFYSEEALTGRYNSDLANGLGNLVARTLNMVEKYQAGVVVAGQAAAEGPAAASLHGAATALLAPDAATGRTPFEHLVDECRFNTLLEQVWAVIQRADQYITETRPFSLAKDPAQAPVLAHVLHQLCGSIRAVAWLAAPAIPRTAEKVWQALGCAKPLGETTAEEVTDFAALLGTQTHRPENLFPRLS